MAKYCINCKYHQYNEYDLRHWCNYPRNEKDLVTGKPFPGYPKICSYARANPTDCGPEGKYWKLKKGKK